MRWYYYYYYDYYSTRLVGGAGEGAEKVLAEEDVGP